MRMVPKFEAKQINILRTYVKRGLKAAIAAANSLSPFKYNVVKWPNIILKSCGVNTARFLKYVRPN